MVVRIGPSHHSNPGDILPPRNQVIDHSDLLRRIKAANSDEEKITIIEAVENRNYLVIIPKNYTGFRGFFSRIGDFFRRLGNSLIGRGFNTFDEYVQKKLDTIIFPLAPGLASKVFIKNDGTEEKKIKMNHAHPFLKPYLFEALITPLKLNDQDDLSDCEVVEVLTLMGFFPKGGKNLLDVPNNELKNQLKNIGIETVADLRRLQLYTAADIIAYYNNHK